MIHLWDNSCYLSKNVWCFLETLHYKKTPWVAHHADRSPPAGPGDLHPSTKWRGCLETILGCRIFTPTHQWRQCLHAHEFLWVQVASIGEDPVSQLKFWRKHQVWVVKIWWSPCLVSLASLKPKSQLRTNWKCWIVGIVPHMFSKSSLRSFPRHSDMIPSIPIASDFRLRSCIFGRSTSSNAQGSTLQRQMEEMSFFVLGLPRWKDKFWNLAESWKGWSFWNQQTWSFRLPFR